MSDLGPGPGVSHAADRQRLLWAGRTTFDVVLDGTQTNDSIALLDQWGERGDVTPMHIHRDEAEIFYLLEGTIEVWAGDERISLGAGGAAYLPAGRPHAFGVTSARARILTVTTPAGFAGFVRAAGVPVVGEQPVSWDFDLGSIMAAAPAHAIEIVGPPPPLPED